MTRLIVPVLAFAFGLAAVGCAAEAPASLGNGDDSSSSKDSKNDDGNDDKASTSTGNIIGSNGSATSPSASLPAPKLLADGPVRTVAGTCNVTANNLVVGNGNITRTTRSVKNFVNVEQLFSGTVIVEEGSDFAVQVEVDDNLQDSLIVQVSDKGTLQMGFQTSGTICSHNARVLVTLPKLEKAGVGSAGEMEITKRTGPSDITLIVAGAGNLTFHGKVATLGVQVSGAGDVILQDGSATTTNVTVSGAGDVTGQSFDAGKVSKTVSGAGDVNL